ncbi:MAG: hypothetical protein AB8B66_02050 [Rickettsiaceae bacterium]
MLTQGIVNQAFLILGAPLCISLVYIILKYKTLLNQKNVQLTQVYMGQHFIHQSLSESINTSDSKLFCNNLMMRIKEYYNLRDIILVDSIKNLSKNHILSLNNDIVEFIQNNLAEIEVMSSLPDHGLTRIQGIYKNESYQFCITPDISLNGLIICIENHGILWNKQDNEGLEGQLNLLKHRLNYH